MLVQKNRQNKIGREENLDAYVGIVVPLKDPYNIFLHVNDMVDVDSPRIRFFAYSIGSKRVVMWGRYDKNRGEFDIHGDCVYKTINLKRMTREWKPNFIYVGNSIVDRFTKKIYDYVGMETKMISREDYEVYKYYLSLYDGRITEEEYLTRFTDDDRQNIEEELFKQWVGEDVDLYDDMEYGEKFDEYMDNLRKKVEEYEKHINRTDISSNALIYKNVEKITGRFYDVVKTGKYYRSENKCADPDECIEGGEGCDVYFFGEDFTSEIQ